MKPILFNTEMVKAILNGRKTMTRRIIKFPKGTTGRLPEYGFVGKSPYLFYPCGIKHSKYKVGDVLYVRETWWKSNDRYYYLADYDLPDLVKKQLNKSSKCRPSIHMPKEAARIFLKVTNVRVERLQDITPHDAWSEGCRIGNSFPWEKHISELQQQCRDILFKSLWNSTIKKSELDRYGWNANPWVFVYQFDRCEKPVGEVKE